MHRRRWTAPLVVLALPAAPAPAVGGTYRLRARIRREGTLPFELGYSKPALVRVG